jgi:hypothetical protein
MNFEQSRRVDAALDQLRSLQRPNPHQPVLLDTRGSTARVAHLEETVATPEIKPPDEEFDEIGQDPVGAEVLAPGRSAFTDDQMPWGDVAFDADLAANMLGDLVGAPTLYAGDVELGKSAGGHAVMIAAENRTATQADAASAWARQYRTPRPGLPSRALDAGGG